MLMPDRIIGFLNENKVRYELVRHVEAFTSQELAQLEHVRGRNHAKVVLVHCQGTHRMLVLPSDYRVDMEKLEGLFHDPVVIDSEEDLRRLFPDCAPGKMPPFGRLYGLPTIIDRSLADQEIIVFEAGTHMDAIKIKMADYLRIAKGEIGEFAEKLQPIKAL